MKTIETAGRMELVSGRENSFHLSNRPALDGLVNTAEKRALERKVDCWHRNHVTVTLGLCISLANARSGRINWR